jgi:hypothetical protein
MQPKTRPQCSLAIGVLRMRRESYRGGITATTVEPRMLDDHRYN